MRCVKQQRAGGPDQNIDAIRLYDYASVYQKNDPWWINSQTDIGILTLFVRLLHTKIPFQLVWIWLSIYTKLQWVTLHTMVTWLSSWSHNIHPYSSSPYYPYDGGWLSSFYNIYLHHIHHSYHLYNIHSYNFEYDSPIQFLFHRAVPWLLCQNCRQVSLQRQILHDLCTVHATWRGGVSLGCHWGVTGVLESKKWMKLSREDQSRTISNNGGEYWIYKSPINNNSGYEMISIESKIQSNHIINNSGYYPYQQWNISKKLVGW